MAEVGEQRFRHRPVVVLPGVHEYRVDRRRVVRLSSKGATFTKFGRVPAITTDLTGVPSNARGSSCG